MSLKEEALRYTRNGWTVIPCHPNTKKPAVDWEVWEHKKPSLEQVSRWWDDRPNANIGAVTGKNFIVVDVDSYKTGIDPREIWSESPTDLIAVSPRGGWHLYYEPKDISNSATSEGLDVRGRNGIIILPPSVIDGKSYRWVRTGRMGQYTPNPLNLPTTKPVNNPLWLTEMLKGVGDGGRDNATATLAGYFESKKVPKDVVLAMLLDWNRKNRPPLSDEDIEKTVESVFKGAKRRTPETGPIKPFSVMSFDAFMRKHVDHSMSWAIEDWLPSSTILMVVAPPGSFKTWFTLDLAVSMAGGRDFLGMYPMKETGPVLIIQQEDSLPGMAGRLAEVLASRYDMEFGGSGELMEWPSIPSLPIFVHEDRKLRFDDNTTMKEFEQVLEQIKPKLVILDPLYSMADTENYMDKIGEAMLRLKSIRDRLGCSFVIVHHAKKSGDGSRTDAWGSTFVNASREGGWHITKPNEIDEPSIIQVRRFFKDGGEFPPITMSVDLDTKSDKHVYRVRLAGEPKEDAVDVITKAVQDGPKSDAELALLTGKTADSIKKLLKLLEEDGLVCRAGKKWTVPMDLPDF